jgi:hypothetical protein
MKKLMLAAALALSLSAPAVQAAEDAATIAAVKEMFEAMNYRAIGKQTFEQMAAALPQMIGQSAKAAIEGNPNLSAEQRTQALQKLQADLPKIQSSVGALLSDATLVDELMDQSIPLYARHFTADEIRQITAFYRTPVGAKTLATMPALTKEAMMLSQRLMMPRVQRMVQQLQAGQAK